MMQLILTGDLKEALSVNKYLQLENKYNINFYIAPTSTNYYKDLRSKILSIGG